MRARRWLLATLVLAAFAAPSSAQQFPTKPITLVVPYAPGGNVDISTRILQAGIGDALGQPIIIENRPGAGGLIAGDYVARSAPDGHTLFVGSNASILLGPMTMPKPPYQWDKAFAPVSGLAVATNMLLVTPKLPVKTVAELVDYAKKNPGKLTLATSSGASINHFLGRAAETEDRHHLDRGALSRQRAGHQRSHGGPCRRRPHAADRLAAASRGRDAPRAGGARTDASAVRARRADDHRSGSPRRAGHHLQRHFRAEGHATRRRREAQRRRSAPRLRKKRWSPSSAISAPTRVAARPRSSRNSSPTSPRSGPTSCRKPTSR